MNHIIEPNSNFDFSQLSLGPPSNISNGVYFTRLVCNNKPLFVQTPTCTSKNGFIKGGKKCHIDLLFDNSDTIFINWIENLESCCTDLLFNGRDDLFQSNIEKDDIEEAFTSLIKIYKSGKFYTIRMGSKQNIRIYMENNEHCKMEDVQSTTNLISICEIQGIKFI